MANRYLRDLGLTITRDTRPSDCSDVGCPVTDSTDEIVQLVELIAKALVDKPEEVSVRAVEGEQVKVLELRVADDDIGKVIGKNGRTAKSIRTLLGAAGMKLKKRFTLEVLD